MKSMTQGIAKTLFSRHPELASIADTLADAVAALCACHTSNGLILACGNGGSAADAAHITGELLKGFCHARPPAPAQLLSLERHLEDAALAAKLQQGVRAINLCEASAILTATANDLSPELVYAQQVFALGRPGDVLIGISTGGNAANVVRALQTARAIGMGTIGLTGAKHGRMDPFCDLLFKVPETETFKIQELHLPLYHALCAMVEAELFG
jgi:phosphoheptose isomerase